VIVARPLRTCAVFLVAAAGAAIGCATSAPSTGYTPPTGIFISAQTIVAGHGCGTGTDQVYKYAVIVSTTSDAGPAFVTSGVFDCFTDGVFSNLPSPDGGSVAFAVSVLAYNRSSFPDALFCPPNTLPCPGDDAGDVFPWKAAANWTATCTVTEIQGVPSITTCSALEPNEPIEAGVSDAGAVEAGAIDAAPSGADSSATD
jgi:hypothetical protein